MSSSSRRWSRRSHVRWAVLAVSPVVGSALVVPAPAVQASVAPEWRQEAEAFPISTVGAGFSDANASGGAAWNLWSFGYLQTTFTAATTGAKEIDVVARGDVAGGVWPIMRVTVDNTIVAEQTVSGSTYQTYSTTLSSVTAGNHTLKVEFTNDAQVNGQDRNLKVDVASVLPSGVEEWRQEAEAFPTRSVTGQQSSDANASGGAYYNMWSNGYLETTMTVPRSGTKQILVVARGQVCLNVWPNMRIVVDGVTLADHTVGQSTYATYTTTTTLSKGSHTLRVQFTNDASTATEDRNLKVDVASLVPVAQEWKQEAESFTTRTAGAATASTLASGGTFWNLWSNGYLQTAMAAASTGRKTVRIVARGAPAAGVYPQLKVWLGTTLLTTLTVDATTFSPYDVPATMNVGANTLKLEYVNDATINGEDRNVHLDVVTLLGDNAFPFVQSLPSPSGGAYVGSRPTLNATYADPDGDAGYVDFEIDTTAGTLVTSGRSALTQAGDVASWTPTSALTNGVTYTWKARAYDGTAYAGAWTATRQLTVDSVAPVAPTVSSATFPAGTWSGTDTTSGAFTLSAGASTDVVGYKYALDATPPATDTTSTSVTLVPGEGQHHLYVQSVDRAGNLSPVTDYAFNAGSGAVTTPSDGDETAKQVALRAVANPSFTGVTYQWRRADTDPWTTLPAADVTSSGSPVTWPVALSAGTHSALTWDVGSTVAGTEGPLQVRATFSGGSTGSTRGTRLVLDTRHSSAATSRIGPGSVNLVTGAFSLTATDVTVHTASTDVALTRSYSSRDPDSDPTGPFGPGWTTAMSVGGSMSPYGTLTANGSLRTVELAGGGSLGFTATSATTFEPQPGADDLTLTLTAGSATPTTPDDDVYELGDRVGDTTTFTWETDAFRPTKVTEAGSNARTTFTYETVGGVTRVARALAPVPAGVTCTSPDITRGCRSVTFYYAPATTPIPGPSGGDYPNRLRSVSLTAWDPATSAMTTVELGHWSYLPSGRLLAAWDSRLPGLKTTYAYDSAGLLTSVTPGADAPYSLTYGSIPGDTIAGRLRSVSRTALTAGTATETVVYGVPLSGATAPADVSAAQTARWGQTDVPTYGTAIFPPDQTPDDDPATGTMPTSWTRATVMYLDVNGREVAMCGPGGSLAIREYDDVGNVVRLLSPANRARALAASATDTAADEAALAARLSELRIFDATGDRLVETFGPEHDVVLANAVTDSRSRQWAAGSIVRARAHTVTAYDEGAPAGTGPYDLPTTVTTSARLADTTTDADARTTTTAYDWTLRAATAVTVDPNGLGLVSRVAYDQTTGLPVKVTTPGGTAAQDTARTVVNTYYTTAANATYPECGGHPEWANLRCRTDVAAQPASGPPVPAKVFAYDLYDAATTTTERDGSTVLRTTTVQYDVAHRPWRTSVTATAGQAVPTTETYYDPATGRATETRALDGTGAVAGRVVRTYDSLGRVVSYTDADGSTSTVTYDLLGRPATFGDGKGTQTYYYDDGTERRGLLTRVVDSAAGTFTATYDDDGRIVARDLPNGLHATLAYDEAGRPTRLDYVKGTSTWLSYTAVATVHGQWARATSSGVSSQQYSYDAAGRLTRVDDAVSGAGCNVRTYSYDGDSNRTALVARQPTSEGECDATATGTTQSYAYDDADRIVTAGYVYDELGRTTSVPAGDAGGAPLTLTYYANDLVRSVTPQDGTTSTATLDPTGGRLSSWTENGTTRVNHYGDDGDNPTWIAEGGAAWTRNVHAFGGLAATQDSAGTVTLPLVNLHGDVAALASASTTATAPLAVYDTTEFGASRDGVTRRYGWLGASQRDGDAAAPGIVMGVRVYNPATGRFLQPDPVPGGSANAYDYANQDPVNGRDLDGRWTYDMSFSLGWSNRGAYEVFRQVKANFGWLFPVPGHANTLTGKWQFMFLHLGPLPGWVFVSDMWANGWQFQTAVLHPDFPGYVWFRINGPTQSSGWLTLRVYGVVPSGAPIFLPCSATPFFARWACEWGEFQIYKDSVRRMFWSKLANNIANMISWYRL